MKKKSFVMLLMLTFIMMLMVGCSSKNEKAFLKYKNQGMKKTTEYEQEFLESYDSVTGKQYKNNATTIEELKKNTIPKAEKWLKSAEALKSDSKEVSDTHKIYVAGVKNAEKAIKVMIESMEKKDKDKTNQVTVILKQQREQMTQYQAKMKEFDKKYSKKGK